MRTRESAHTHSNLIGGGLLLEGGAEGKGSVGVDGVVTFVDEADGALLVDDDVGAKSPLIIFVLNAVGFQDAVGLEHFVVHVAEQRKMQAVLLGEGGVGGRTVEADAEDRSVGGGDLAWTARICLVQPSEKAST